MATHLVLVVVSDSTKSMGLRNHLTGPALCSIGVRMCKILRIGKLLNIEIINLVSVQM